MPAPPDLIAAFDMLFEGRRDAWGAGRPGGAVRVARGEWSVSLVEAHLEGREPLAVLPVRDDGKCLWACLDADCPDDPERALAAAEEARRALEGAGVRAWTERTGGKGAHVWAFFSEPVPAGMARALMDAAGRAARKALPEGGPPLLLEPFPKQDRASSEHPGNPVRLPYPGAEESFRSGTRCILDGGRPLRAEEFAGRAWAARAPEAAVRAALAALLDALEGRPSAPEAPAAFPLELPAEAAARLADALAPWWERPRRNFLALGLAGLLARRGVSEGSALALMKRICAAAGDEEARDRLRAARQTYEKAARGEEIAAHRYLLEQGGLPWGVVSDVYKALRSLKGRGGDPEALLEEISLTAEAAPPEFYEKPPAEGLLADVCDWFGWSTDANLEVRCAAALVLMSLCVGRCLWIPQGRRRIYPNLWILVAGPSSETRKSTVQELAEDLWREVTRDPAVRERLARPPSEDRGPLGVKDEDPEEKGRALALRGIWSDAFSPEALLHQMALVSLACEECRFAVFTDEAGYYLIALEKKDYMATAAGHLLKLYGCPDRYSMHRRQMGKLAVHEARNVFMAWFLATTPATLQDALAAERLRYNGFWQRCLVVPAGPREKGPQYEFPAVPPEVTEAVAGGLRRMALLGPAPMRLSPEAREMFLGFARELAEYRKDRAGMSEADYLARMDVHALKFAILMEASLRAEAGEDGGPGWEDPLAAEPPGGGEVEISAEAMRRAVGLARYFWKATEFAATGGLLSSGTEFAAKMQAVLDALRRAGGRARRRDLLRAVRMSLREFQEILDTLAARGEVTISTVGAKSPKGGRPSTVVELKRKS